VIFINKLIFQSEELLDPRTTFKLEEHSLLVVGDCLFNIFAGTLHIWILSPAPQPEDAPRRGDEGPT
jgi:hypothetical protein